MTNVDIEQLKQERKELNRRIRAAQKAEAEAKAKAHDAAIFDLGQATAQALCMTEIEDIQQYTIAIREGHLLLSTPSEPEIIDDQHHDQEPQHEWA